MPFNQLGPLLFRKVAILQYTYFVFLVHISKAFSKCEDSWKTHYAICINLKNSFIPTRLYLRYTRESEMLRPRFFIAKNTCRPLAKKSNPLEACLREQKYNLKAIMRRDHKSYMGSPCLSLSLFSCWYCPDHSHSLCATTLALKVHVTIFNSWIARMRKSEL